MQAVKGSACVSRVGEGVPRSRTSLQRLFRCNHMHVVSGEHRPRLCFLIAVIIRPIVAGRLPATAGWQPALPRTQNARCDPACAPETSVGHSSGSREMTDKRNLAGDFRCLGRGSLLPKTSDEIFSYYECNYERKCSDCLAVMAIIFPSTDDGSLQIAFRHRQ